jgi:uncharacterized membrane protein
MCEVFFLKDVFAGNYPRMNTVFKFYFQAWVLLSMCCGAGLFFIMENFNAASVATAGQRLVHRGVAVLWCAILGMLLLAGMVYPLAGTYNRTDHYAHRTNSLDGLDYLQTDPSSPGDYAAIRWLNAHVTGSPVIVEALGPDYSNYARISAFTGLPTLMGWEGHEYQWRVNWFNRDDNASEFNRRKTDLDLIYTNPDQRVVLSTLARYQAQYLYVGPLEQEKYPMINLHRFSGFMQIVYNANGVTIYKVR